MALLQLSVLLSGVLALTGAVPALRGCGWYRFWPVPIMAFGIVVGFRDLIWLMAARTVGLSTPPWVLGLWAAVVMVVAGAMEVAGSRRGELTQGGVVAPGLLVAGGVTLTAPLVATPEGGLFQLAGVPTGLLMIAVGAMVALGRLRSIQRGVLRYAWPVALALGAVGIVPALPRPEPFAEAKAEIAGLEAAWRRRVFRAARTDVGGPGEIAPMVRYRVEANEVYVYLLAHNTPLDARRAP